MDLASLARAIVVGAELTIPDDVDRAALARAVEAELNRDDDDDRIDEGGSAKGFFGDFLERAPREHWQAAREAWVSAADCEAVEVEHAQIVLLAIDRIEQVRAEAARSERAITTRALISKIESRPRLWPDTREAVLSTLRSSLLPDGVFR
jgi:hypothetical protein